MSEEKFRKVLLVGAETGQFLHAVAAALSTAREERDELACVIATLHNEGLVDVVAAFGDLKNKAPGGPNFFLTRHVFEQALPHINAPVGSVMRCVLHLCREAGQDMAAGTIMSGYIEFCANDVSRPREALKLIEADFNELGDMLVATIAAGSQLDNSYYLAELLRLMRHPDIEVRRRAVFAVARVRWPEGAKVPDDAIIALEKIISEETDDQILASALKSAFALFEQDKTLEVRIVSQIGAALEKGNDYSLHAASELLMSNTINLPATLLNLLLANLKRVNPENIGTLNNVDYGIAHLLSSDAPEKGFQLLQELLVAHDGKLRIEVFDSAVAKICNSSVLMSRATTRWFLSGERALCTALHEIANTHFGDEYQICVDTSELISTDHDQVIFLARKAIGYFFIKEVTAASVVISLMRHASTDQTLHELGGLLFNPLLLNYPGSLRDYVKIQAAQESGLVKTTIENAWSSVERYLEVLRAVPNLPALHAGQSQRESYRRHMSESMAESMKSAEKKSILRTLCSRSTLLYGNKSINYIYAGDGEPHRMEIPLTSHSYSFDFPRMDNIDPCGLDYMLRVFRAERFCK